MLEANKATNKEMREAFKSTLTDEQKNDFAEQRTHWTRKKGSIPCYFD